MDDDGPRKRVEIIREEGEAITLPWKIVSSQIALQTVDTDPNTLDKESNSKPRKERLCPTEKKRAFGAERMTDCS